MALLLTGALFFAWGVLTQKYRIFPHAYVSRIIHPSPGASQFKDTKKRDTLWAQKVIKGGYILHLRHAQREKWPNAYGFDAYELHEKIAAEKSTFWRATCLTDQGKEGAKLIKHVFAITGVKVSQVISSPSCRSRQTAMLAFDKIDQIDNSLLHRVAMVPEQYEMFAKQMRKLIDGLTPPKGANIILSGHNGTIAIDKKLVIDVDETTAGPERRRGETGFTVLEKVDGKLIARHTFSTIAAFANATIKLPAK